MKIARVTALLMALLLMAWPGMAQEQLSDDELRQMLYERNEQAEDGGQFLVMPDDFRMPTLGPDGRYSLLLLGVDSYGEEVKGRSDAMVLAVLDARQGSLKLISFMRDLYVGIPGRGHNRMNAAYAFGGGPLLGRVLQDSFGLQPEGYVAVNFSLMADLVDAIGGVELTVADYELRPLNGILTYYNGKCGLPSQQGKLMQPGTQVLSGLQAMCYARIRKPDSDFERVQRQQRVLAAIYHQLRQTDKLRLADILFEYAVRIRTDLSLSDALGLSEDLLALGDLDISTLSIPVKGSFSSKLVHGAYVLVPNLKKNQEAIQRFLAAPGAMP